MNDFILVVIHNFTFALHGLSLLPYLVSGGVILGSSRHITISVHFVLVTTFKLLFISFKTILVLSMGEQVPLNWVIFV